MDHPARAHYIGKGVKMMDSVKAKRDIAGNVNPQRNIMFLAWGRISIRQFLQHLSIGNGTKEVRLGHFPYPFNIIKLPPGETPPLPRHRYAQRASPLRFAH